MLRRFALAAAASLAAGPALAHHPMGGALPLTFAQGLLSGLGHPVIGPDHLAAVVAAGLLAAAAGATPLLPLAFVLASVGGVGLHLAMLDLPLAETLVALSVVALGLALLARRLPRGAGAVLAAAFAAAGVVHGYAYGESIVGAEPTPLYAYLLGLVLVQGAVAPAAFLTAKLAARAGEVQAGRLYRLASAAVLLVGVGALALA
jgi:urease accessory protein